LNTKLAKSLIKIPLSPPAYRKKLYFASFSLYETLFFNFQRPKFAYVILNAYLCKAFPIENSGSPKPGNKINTGEVGEWLKPPVC